MKKLLLSITLFTIVAVLPALSDNKVIVVGQNVQNFFYSLDRTRTTDNSITLSNYTTEEGRTAKLNAIINALSVYKADIYAFNEVEAKPEALQLIANAMSQKTGFTYLAIEDGYDYDLNDPSEASGVIKSGYIYNTATIKPYGNSFATGWGYIYQRQMRLQTFEQISSGERFALSINHFKAGDPADADGSGTTNGAKRIDNATALLEGLNNAQDADVLIIGDLNSQLGEECLNMIQNAGFEEQLIKYAGEYAYTHCYGGGEIIDHVYANSTMAEQVTKVEVMPVANKCSLNDESLAYSDHNPYLVELNLKHFDTPTYSFIKATSVKADGEYLIVAPLNGKIEIAKPVSSNKNYDYLYTLTVTEDNGVITVTDLTNVFTFEDAGSNQFYIKDSNGRYAYQTHKSGTNYYTTVAVTSNKNEAHKFTTTLQTDGTFKILNTTSNYYMYATIYNNTTPEFTMTNWSSLNNGQYLPWLYERVFSTGIRNVSTTTATPVNVYFNLSGQRVAHPVKGLYIVGGRKVYVK